MAIRKLLYYPDSKLRTPCETVTQFDTELKQLVDDLFETMYEKRGVGLAAIQIGIPKKLFIVDPESNGKNKLVFINPEILETKGHVIHEEGCLSVPGIFGKIERAKFVKIKAKDLYGKEFILECDEKNRVGHIAQHEYDHLYGKLFVDYLSSLKQQRIKNKLKKLQKNHEIL